MKIRPMRAEMFRADEYTDMAKLFVTHRNFANSPKKEKQETSIFRALF
jgi:hypothetical protein